MPDKVTTREQAFVMLLCESPDFWGRWEYIWDVVGAQKRPMLSM